MESTWIEASSAIGMPAHDRSGSHVTLGRNVSPRRNGLLDRILRKVLRPARGAICMEPRMLTARAAGSIPASVTRNRIFHSVFSMTTLSGVA